MLAYGGGKGHRTCRNQLSAPGKVQYLVEVERALGEVRAYYRAAADALEQGVIPCLAARRDLLQNRQTCQTVGCVETGEGDGDKEEETQTVEIDPQSDGPQGPQERETESTPVARDGDGADRAGNGGDGAGSESSVGAARIGIDSGQARLPGRGLAGGRLGRGPAARGGGGPGISGLVTHWEIGPGGLSTERKIGIK